MWGLGVFCMNVALVLTGGAATGLLWALMGALCFQIWLQPHVVVETIEAKEESHGTDREG
jgi:hypothetical protein